MKSFRTQQHFLGHGCTYELLWVWLFLAGLQIPVFPQISHVERSLEFVRKGDLDSAEKEANLALAQPATRALGFASLGAIRLEQRRYNESINYLQRAVELDSHLLGARLSLGQAYLLQGKLDRAEKEFGHVLRVEPSNYTARFTLARIESEQGHYEASLETTKPVVPRLRRSPDGLLLLAADYVGLQKKNMARGLVKDWKTTNTVAPDLSVTFALLLTKIGLVGEAVEVLEQAKRGGRASYEVFFNLAGCYLTKGDLNRAEKNYRLALAVNENCTACYLQLSRIAERQEQTEKALSYLIKAKGKEPENPEVLFEFGKVCLERDLLDDALTALQRAVELRPDHDAYSYVMASAYVGKKRYKDARVLLDRLLNKHPNDAVLNYAMGTVLYEQGDLEDSENYLKKSISIQATQVAAYYYLALVADKRGQTAEAADLFQTIVRRYPNHAPSYAALGNVLMKERNYAEAEQVLQKAIVLDPNSASAHYHYGILLGRLGRKYDADKELELFRKLESEERTRSALRLYLLDSH